MDLTIKMLRGKVAECETTFQLCLEVLCDLKVRNIKQHDFADRLLSFQVKLVMCLADIHRFREDVNVKKRQLIGAKHKYNETWFRKRMKLYDQFITGIDKIINMGKTIGDAFAYMFYSRNTELLQKHLDHAHIPLFPARSGFQGEMQFLKKFPHLDGHLTIYHGITHILRFGDFSFVNLANLGEINIGELKTIPIDKKSIDINLNIISASSSEMFQYHKINKTVTSQPRSKTEIQLDRQLKAIEKLYIPVDPSIPNVDERVTDNTYLLSAEEIFKQTTPNDLTQKKLSEGLLINVIRYRQYGLFSKIFNRNTFRILEKIKNVADTDIRKLIHPSKKNSLQLGQVLYNNRFIPHTMRGIVPLFWQPLGVDFIKALYLSDCEVHTVFNPIYLIEKIEELGYNIKSKYKISDELKPDQYTISNFKKFVHLITDYLHTEDAVLDSLKKIKEVATSKKLSKIKVQFHQHVDEL
jgi:hypothetical protein